MSYLIRDTKDGAFYMRDRYSYKLSKDKKTRTRFRTRVFCSEPGRAKQWDSYLKASRYLDQLSEGLKLRQGRLELVDAGELKVTSYCIKLDLSKPSAEWEAEEQQTFPEDAGYKTLKEAEKALIEREVDAIKGLNRRLKVIRKRLSKIRADYRKKWRKK